MYIFQDVLSGFVLVDGEYNVTSVHLTIRNICNWWEENKYPVFFAEFDENTIKIQADTKKITDMSATTTINEINDTKRWRFTWWIQYFVVFYANIIVTSYFFIVVIWCYYF